MHRPYFVWSMQTKNERKSRVDRFIDAREKPGLIPMSKMWVEKHRPKTVRDIRGQAATVERLTAYGETGSFPHLLFAGPPGTGKTTAALALCCFTACCTSGRCDPCRTSGYHAASLSLFAHVLDPQPRLSWVQRRKWTRLLSFTESQTRS